MYMGVYLLISGHEELKNPLDMQIFSQDLFPACLTLSGINSRERSGINSKKRSNPSPFSGADSRKRSNPRLYPTTS